MSRVPRLYALGYRTSVAASALASAIEREVDVVVVSPRHEQLHGREVCLVVAKFAIMVAKLAVLVAKFGDPSLRRKILAELCALFRVQYGPGWL